MWSYPPLVLSGSIYKIEPLTQDDSFGMENLKYIFEEIGL